MPVHVACPVCRAEYNLKDDVAGRKVKCPKCESIITVPEAPVAADSARNHFDPQLHPAFQRDKYLVKQKRMSLHEKYFVLGEDQQPVLFVERPVHYLRSFAALGACIVIVILGIAASVGIATALGKDQEVLVAIASILGMGSAVVGGIAVMIMLFPKRHIGFYSDAGKSLKLLEVLQENKFQLITAWYTVRDGQGEPLGRLKKNYLYNFFRKRWDIYRPDGSLWIVAREDSLLLSLLRRFLGPMLGLLRTNFVYLKPDEARVIGEFNRKMTLFDQYVLDMSDDTERFLDRRVAVAAGVLLDTGERR